MGVRLLPGTKAQRRRRGAAVTAASVGVLLAAGGVAVAWDDDDRRSHGSSSSWHEGWDGADTVFLNGRILEYTRGGKGYDYAEALVVDKGRIKYVGNRHAAIAHVGDETKLVNLRGKLMMPGLGDGHWHGVGIVQCGMDYEGGTIDQVLGKIKDCLLKAGQVEHLKGDLVLSVSQLQGDGLLPAGTQLDRHVLDRLSKDPSEDPFGTGTTRPIVVRNMDGHKFATNTKAINNAGLERADAGSAGRVHRPRGRRVPQRPVRRLQRELRSFPAEPAGLGVHGACRRDRPVEQPRHHADPAAGRQRERPRDQQAAGR